MIDRKRICRDFCVAMLAAVASLTSTLRGDEPRHDETYSLQYWADARVFSLVPGQEFATYRSFSGGGVGPNGTLTMGVGDKQRKFDVSIQAKLKSHRFLATVTIEPGKEDTVTKASEVSYDLSDLSARSLEIARGDDGRVYRLSLLPQIIEKPKPKQFKAGELLLDYWSFPSSPVILNDEDYVGRLAMSSGPIAWCEIPGVAKVEFSLLHLKNAKASGTLENGVINIVHEDGTTLRISDVKNGVNRDVLSGGPYRVWVRWTKPTLSVEEYRAVQKQQIVSLKERVKNGDLTLSAGTLERLEKRSESGRIGLSSNGIRPVEDGELVTPVE